MAGYLHTLVEEDLKRPPALSEILAPIHEEFRQSGMTEDELSRSSMKPVKRSGRRKNAVRLLHERRDSRSCL